MYRVYHNQICDYVAENLHDALRHIGKELNDGIYFNCMNRTHAEAIKMGYTICKLR